MKFVAISALLFMFAPAVTAQTSNASQVDKQAQSAQADPKDRMICRRIEITGSLVKRGKVCKSAKEWDRITQRGNESARTVIESGSICSGCRGN